MAEAVHLIPLATTTISVLVLDGDTDPYENPSLTTVASGVKAHFSSPRGSDRFIGGDQEIIDMRLDCDVCAFPFTAIVVDESNNDQWKTVWVRPRIGLGLDHIEAGVQRVQGMVPS
jgi:hypothetical protein